MLVVLLIKTESGWDMECTLNIADVILMTYIVSHISFVDAWYKFWFLYLQNFEARKDCTLPLVIQSKGYLTFLYNSTTKYDDYRDMKKDACVW